MKCSRRVVFGGRVALSWEGASYSEHLRGQGEQVSRSAGGVTRGETRFRALKGGDRGIGGSLRMGVKGPSRQRGA